MTYFQIASAEGSAIAADVLSEAFGERFHADPIFGLGQAVDAERRARYHKVSDFLSDYDYLHAVVHELDVILPLPPALLPTWDGKFIWLQEHKANAAPPIPAEQRITEMARAKGLDPSTRRPLAAPK